MVYKEQLDMQGFFFQIPSHISSIFSSAHCFLVLGKPILLSRNHTPLSMEWCLSKNKYRIKGYICMPSFGMNQNCTVYWCKYWISVNPGLGVVGGNMHFFHYCLLHLGTDYVDDNTTCIVAMPFISTVWLITRIDVIVYTGK
jgi:hypothetical protein